MRYVFRFISLLFRNMPPPSPGRLLMPAVLAGIWTTLKAVGLPDSEAFVWAAVLAQAAHLWAVLPVTIRRQRHVFGRARQATSWAIAASFAVLSVQVWWSEPWLCQRLVSIYCGWYALTMAFGVWGNRDVLNHTVPVSDKARVSPMLRRHLLKLNALIAILIIATNETLLAVEAPLNISVLTLSLLPVALHYLYQIILRLTAPPLYESES